MNQCARVRHGWSILVVVGCLNTANAAESLELTPGILIDPQRALAYVADPAGYMHAVDLSNGRSNWTSSEHALPIAIVQQQLLALGTVEQFGLGMLLLAQPETGAVLDRIAFDLPEQASAELVAKPQRTFAISTSPHSGGLRIHWRYTSRLLRGAMIVEPGETESNNGLQQLQGALDLSLSSAGNHVVALREPLAAPLPIAPELSPNQQLAGLPGRQFRSANDAHVLLSSSIEHPEFGNLYRWEFRDRSAGRLLGTLDSHYALTPFVVLDVAGDAVLIHYAQPISVRAADGNWSELGPRLVGHNLKSGKELWRFDVLDREYRGPMPP